MRLHRIISRGSSCWKEARMYTVSIRELLPWRMGHDGNSCAGGYGGAGFSRDQGGRAPGVAGAQGCRGADPAMAVQGRVDRLRGRGCPRRADAEAALRRVVDAVRELSPLLPHDSDYHEALAKDLYRWAEGGFEIPDFLDSLLAFQPAAHREHGLQHLVVFPMYTQNGNPDRNLEAVVLRMVWPDWLAELERTRYDNPLFCGITFEDFTAGYDTNSAVLFPETIAVRAAPERFSWGGIFCDREAARFRRVTEAAVGILGLELPDDIREMVADQDRCQQAFVLWDMV